jgi:hypothetical protein
MRLLLDECVPDAVARVFRERGHEVILAREVALAATPDPAINADAEVLDAIVVTWNRKDFKADNRRKPDRNVRRYKRAGWIIFKCPEPQGEHRLRQLMPEVEFCYARSRARGDRRFMMEIHSERYYVEA